MYSVFFVVDYFVSKLGSSKMSGRPTPEGDNLWHSVEDRFSKQGVETIFLKFPRTILPEINIFLNSLFAFFVKRN